MKILIITIGVYAMYHLIEILVGLVFCIFPRTHRLGIRILAMSFAPSYAGAYCREVCDGSCGNWTCPNYHVPNRRLADEK